MVTLEKSVLLKIKLGEALTSITNSRFLNFKDSSYPGVEGILECSPRGKREIKEARGKDKEIKEEIELPF